MTRRRWQIAATVLISILAGSGAVFEFAGRRTEGDSNLFLLAWIAVWLGSLVLLITLAAGANRTAGRKAGIEEAVNTLPVGLALYDSAGTLRHCNEVFRQAFPDPAIQGNIDGDHEMADGRWMNLQRRELADGGCAITALDISRMVALESDFRAARQQFGQFLSAAAEWIWETDILHRFSMISWVDADGDDREFDWMIGRSLAELTGGGEDANGWAAEGSMRGMDKRDRLREIRLTLYPRGRAVPIRLGGVPRYDDDGEFLGYRGVGLWDDSTPPFEEPAARIEPSTRDEPAGWLLLVDDNSTNLNLAKSILNRMGYEVDTVDGGPRAIEAVRTADYAAVLLDIGMPDMDGFEVTAAIRELPPPQGDIPVIAMTAHTGADQRRRCLDACMDDHVGKPIDRAVLAAVLRRLAGPPPGIGAPDKGGDTMLGQPGVAGLVNDDILAQLRNDAGPALVNELIGAFMAETDERLIRIEAAAAAGKLEDISADAHSMKSSSGTFGALPLQALSARLESAAMQGDAGAVAAAYDALPELVSKTWREFAAHGFRRE